MVTPPAPTPPPPTLSFTKFLAFGDSLTAGQSAVSSRYSLDSVTSYPAYLRQMLAAGYPSQSIEVDNRGRPGEWAADGQFRLGVELGRSDAQVLLLLEGVNDLAARGEAGLDAATAAVESMVAEATRRGLRVFLATLPPQRQTSSRAAPTPLLLRYNDWMRRIARDRGATLVDLYVAFGTNDALLSLDGVHPTEGGYRVMAQAFGEAIERTLRQQ